MPIMQRIQRFVNTLKSWEVWILTALATGPAFALLPAPYIGRHHDDALYVLAAEALRQGHYLTWYWPGHPPITDITPGFPLLLCLWVRSPIFPFLAGLAGVVIHGVNTLLVREWFVKKGGPGFGLGLAVVFAVNPLVLSQVGVLMPESIFLTLVLLLMRAWDRGGWSYGWGQAFLYFIRPAALPLWVAGLVEECRQRRKGIWARWGVPAALGLAWWGWSQSAGGLQEQGELARQYGGKDGGHLFQVVLANSLSLIHAVGSSLSTGMATELGSILLLLALWGALKGLKKTPAVPELFFLFSLGMHLLWPWWYDRYALVLLPFVLGLAFQGLRGGVRRTVLGIIMVSSLSTALIQWPLIKSERKTLETPPQAATYGWIKDHVPTSTPLASLFYGRDIYYTGRVFFPLPLVKPGRDFVGELNKRRVGYVLWEETRDLGFSRANNPITQDLGRIKQVLAGPHFQPVYADPTAGVTLYAVAPSTQ